MPMTAQDIWKPSKPTWPAGCGQPARKNRGHVPIQLVLVPETGTCPRFFPIINIATARIGSETVTYSGQNTETGEASTYTAGAGENLVHEVVGHGTDWFYGDGATSQAPIGPGHPSGFAPDTPVREVPAMEAENAFIQQKGIPFRRTEYSTNNSVYVVRGRRQ